MFQINSDFPVGNAAGHCKDVAEVARLAESAATFIVGGSFTKLFRLGNPDNTFDRDLNSLGLPNLGIAAVREMAPEMIRIAHAAGKPIIANVAGLSPMEFGELAQDAQEMGFDGVEVNVACPNVADGGKRKPIISHCIDLFDSSIACVFDCVDPSPDFVVWLKLSPMDPERMDQVAWIIRRYPVHAVITQNTVPNCLDYRKNGKPLIDTPDRTGYAGASGQQIFHQALGQVKQWRDRLPEEILVGGAGGVQSGEGVQKMLWAGAAFAQVGTAYIVGGAGVFGPIATEFVGLNSAVENETA